jgi:hypothetical protein
MEARPAVNLVHVRLMIALVYAGSLVKMSAELMSADIDVACNRWQSSIVIASSDCGCQGFEEEGGVRVGANQTPRHHWLSSLPTLPDPPLRKLGDTLG